MVHAVLPAKGSLISDDFITSMLQSVEKPKTLSHPWVSSPSAYRVLSIVQGSTSMKTTVRSHWYDRHINLLGSRVDVNKIRRIALDRSPESVFHSQRV